MQKMKKKAKRKEKRFEMAKFSLRKLNPFGRTEEGKLTIVGLTGLDFLFLVIYVLGFYSFLAGFWIICYKVWQSTTSYD